MPQALGQTLRQHGLYPLEVMNPALDLSQIGFDKEFDLTMITVFLTRLGK